MEGTEHPTTSTADPGGPTPPQTPHDTHTDVKASSKSARSKSRKPMTASSISSLDMPLTDTSSSSSVYRLKLLAELETARTKMSFATRRAHLQREKARVEEEEKIALAESARKKANVQADQHILDAELKVAVAEANMRACNDSDSSDTSSKSVMDTSIRVQQYVDEMANQTFHSPVHVHDQLPISIPSKNGSGGRDSVNVTLKTRERRMLPQIPQNLPKLNAPSQSVCNTPNHLPVANPPVENPPVPGQQNVNMPILNPHAPTFVPQNNVFDLASFILKKDLMLTRLTNYDDKPENFVAWKTSFKSLVKDACISAPEELDLLVRWLGPESKHHAKSIRAATTGDPIQGLKVLWQRLSERYGSPEMVENAIKSKLNKFPKFSEPKKLYELYDILCEIKALKEDPIYSGLFAYFDTSVGVLPIAQKLTSTLQGKWATKASKYKQVNYVSYPPFSIFCEFIKEMATTLNDPGLYCPQETKWKPRYQSYGQQKGKIDVKKTGVKEESAKCPLHPTLIHTLNQCKAFRKKTLQDRRQFLREHNLCYRCCLSDSHTFLNCNAAIKCEECGSLKHPSALHKFTKNGSGSNQNKEDRTKLSADSQHGGEQSRSQQQSQQEEVLTKCTTVCGKNFRGRSCAKAVLVNVYPKDNPTKCLRLYALIDDQSNTSLGRSKLFDHLEVPMSQSHSFTLTSCAGHIQTSGRIISGLIVASLDGSIIMNLPPITECNDIPDDREEIATSEVVKHHDHLKDLPLPAMDSSADILLLIGRDLVEAHHIHDQRTGPNNSPFALKLNLGWVVIGNVCLNGKHHSPTNIAVFKTNTISQDRESIFEPCSSRFYVTQGISVPHTDICTSDIFKKTAKDDEIGLSLDDRQFLEIMEKGFAKDPCGKWKAPLPFKEPRLRLPSNRLQALKRAHMLDADLQRNPIKRQHFITFMEGITQSGALEVAPPMTSGKECWYLPLFGVYHPRKPDKIRGVFDSSVKFDGISLNNVLLKGPNLTNDLLGVLMRFRKDKVAISADIELMFYSFLVREVDRDFLRFFWHRNNNLHEDLIEFRMKVQVFGNTPSPAIATYGLRKTVQNAEDDIREFVTRNFYVDDALVSLPSSTDAISLLQRTQKILMEEAKIRLHKIASNDIEVMNSFPAEDLEKNLKTLDISADELPMQQSLGLSWDINSDCMTFSARIPDKPFTKRGLLSVINSLFDPLGFIAPIVIHGRILYREICEYNESWDDLLPNDREKEWSDWKLSLNMLENLRIPRMLTPISLTSTATKEVHIYSDASEKAISAVAFLRTSDKSGNTHVGFILGKSRIAPRQGHTIPRLELCAAVLATELAQIITKQLDLDPDCFKYYTDSKVILGYLNNHTRRFYNYVCNRVSIILKRSKSDQWSYVSTQNNPADIGTRCSATVETLSQSMWLKGPPQLLTAESIDYSAYPLIDPDTDKEVRPIISVMKTKLDQSVMDRFERYSTWKRLVHAESRLRSICKFWIAKVRKMPITLNPVTEDREAELHIIRNSQTFAYGDEIDLIREKKSLPATSSIISLHPILDDQGILRVGGRLSNAPLSIDERHPVILPGKSHVARLIVTHLHEKGYHQGRLLTEGAVRSNGYWIVGCKRLVNSVIHKCVKCRKLRGKLEFQQMGILPTDRVRPGPPFSSIGLDVFGPWPVLSRKTRGGMSNSKRWAVLFTCMTTRAIHIEVIEEMSSSSFINALRRFISLRGPVKEIRSDRGTNFIGALDDIKADAIFTEKGSVQNFLREHGIVWIFNPPHSSHRGGSWERMIGISRKILDSMLLDASAKQLTHEVLCTFMCEVCAVVNSRPICPISTDPENPYIISPSMLLTQKAFPDIHPSAGTNIREIYRSQWKHVQCLSDMFWKRWKEGYLQNLQIRQKWHTIQPDVKIGDVILLRDKDLPRGQWPIGLIVNVFKSETDSKVRTVEVRIVKDGKLTTYIRPVTELVVLVD